MKHSQWWKKQSLSSYKCAGKNLSPRMVDKVLFSTLVVGCLVLNSPATLASAEVLSKKYDFDIPRERADLALTTFAEQANLTLIFPYDKVKEIQAHKLSGHYSIDDAIDILLRNTGLKMVVDTNGQLMIIQNTNNQESEEMPKKTKLSTAIVAIISSVFTSQYAAAQDNGTAPTAEEVIVTGIRQSLQRNMDIKRDASGVVDAITAEDIGKFPDSNIAASLQRVPGVSIQRSGARGEPTGITVRGFGGDFNETLFDGRRISTASGGRSVDFSTVGADFVGGVSVMKTPDVTMGSNSIGATVNISYPKPFDHPGQKVALSASGSTQDQSGEIKPTLGALYSNTFADDTLGILVNLIQTEQETEANHVFVSGWQGGKVRPCQLTANCTNSELNAPGSLVSWSQIQFGADQNITTDERLDGRIAFQWKPNDQLLLTIDDNYSRQEVETFNYGFGVWFDFNAFRNVKQDSNGTIVDFVNLDDVMNLNAGINRSLLETNQIGVNVKYDLNDNLSYTFDLAHAKSELNPDGQNSTDGMNLGYGGALGCDMGVAVTGDSSSHLPVMSTFGPSCNESKVVRDPSVIGSHVIVRMRQENTDTIDQAKFAVNWTQDNLKLSLGASIVDDNFTLQNSNTFANNFWQTWSGYGLPSGRTTGVVIPTSVPRHFVSTSDFIPGFSGNDALIPELLAYNPFDVYSYLEGLGNPQTKNIPGYNYDCCGTNYTGKLELALDPGSVQDITETTTSLFLKIAFDTELGSLPFHINAGVREEQTEIESKGQGRVPTQLTLSPADPTLLTTTFSDSKSISTSHDYAFLLPSLDLKLELTDELNLRFDASRTLTRPSINFLTPVLNVGSLPRVGALTATGGNPKLEPFLSDNMDLALEWYYQDNSYVAGNYFVKDVTNFIVQGTQRQTINDVIDPSTGQKAIYNVSQRVNGPKARVDGLELAWQHVFGESGFGFNANATIVNTDKPYDRNDLSQSGFAVTGLADSMNFVGFYDRNGFELRVAVNWRDEYLLQFGQGQNISEYGAEPTFVNASTQIDVSGSYAFTEQLNVFFEATNITNETMSTHGRYDNQLLDAWAYGSRYKLGVRYRF
ncbi:TonB-dependent receptor [Cellvibrio zantedeschiae]|uniref:TonB-dependent receptor n=1 Tax=Cellvibrio zantedeschiae TaxID=1237077 RepID=A0ABQ3BBC4_9GAMM|nr:TonB-dependent receptor [Cellvibrio zantedeschiae]GGY84371.1 TonB-dependent receptor [Cellvibrio zantedeschiae]